MLMKKVILCFAVAMLATSPAAAQNTFPAGPSGDPLQFWEGYSMGTYVIVGGLVFVVVYGGLQLVGSDDDAPVTPNPSPPASPSTSSTS